ncbi:hypothetical protein GOV14_03935 [Candidatus Pacearchaeota archaeon]|nr:hypothetical protein [Candidatus Pacearchaeota archaeon]
MKINLTPKSNLGRWSVGLIISFFVFLGLFFLFVKLGERGGDTFFSNLKLTIPMIIAGLCGVCAFLTGFTSIIKNKERSVFVFLVTLMGFFILLYILAEFLFPH